MNIGDIIGSAWNSVKSRKFRFALNLIGILIGCAAVTGFVSITQGLSDNISGQLQIFGPQNIMVVPGGFTGGTMSIGTLTLRDLTTIEKVQHVIAATPIIANKMATYTLQGKIYRVSTFGITEDYQKINQNTEISDGRGLVRSDNGVVIIGANVALPQDQTKPVLGIGDRITLNTRVNDVDKTLTVRVVGILAKTGASFGVNLDDSIAMSLRDAQQFYEKRGTSSLTSWRRPTQLKTSHPPLQQSRQRWARATAR